MSSTTTRLVVTLSVPILSCLNLSRTPETPKSGEVQLQTAPTEATAAMISIASGQFGMYLMVGRTSHII